MNGDTNEPVPNRSPLTSLLCLPAELLADPNNERYVIDLNIAGAVNTEDENNAVDINLRNMVPRGGNFFRVEDGPNGLRLRLVRSVDRDVSDVTKYRAQTLLVGLWSCSI